MGVSGLLTLLKSIQRPTNLCEFRGQTIGVDVYGWLHRGAVACAVDLALGNPSTRHVEYALHRVRMLVHFGITPYLVFDGDRLPSKAATEDHRATRRQESRRTGLELLQLGRKTKAYQELQKAIDITPEMAGQLIEELKRSNIQYVVAPYEADSQLVYLEQQGLIDSILSEDSDLLIFGAKTLLTKLDAYGECVMIRQADYTSCREINLTGWTCADLRRMAILNGCDYLQGIRQMGLKTAHRLVRKYKTIETLIQCAQLEGKYRFPNGYLDSFNQAEMTFLYQWVYCPTAKSLVNLTRPESEDQLVGLSCIGDYVEPAIARRVASGELNPMTKSPIRVEWPSNYRQPPLITKRSGKENEVPNNTKIDSFFTTKSNRVPLAELDPNSFKPSQTQQQLLDRNHGRSWSPVATDQRPTTVPSLRLNNIQNGPLGNSTSAPQPRKRQRLCTEDDNSDAIGVLEERSKFFPSNSIKNHFPARNRRSKDAKINIWSDDSVEEAMSAMPELNVFAAPPDISKGPLKERNVNVNLKYPDKPGKELRTAEVLTEDEVTSHDGPRDALENESPFSNGLQAQIRDLRERYSLNSKPSKTKGVGDTAVSEPQLHSPTLNTLVTPRPSRLASNKNADVEDADVDATVEETPMGKSETRPPDSPLDRKNSAPRPRASPSDSPFAAALVSDRVTPQGSEDLLLVPDSDAETESGRSSSGARDGGGSLERVSVPAQDNDDDEEVSEDDGAGGTEQSRRRRPLFDLKQFAFAGRKLQFAEG